MSSSIKRKATVITSAALAFHLASCTPEPKTILIIEQISAIGPDGATVGELFSDVCGGTPPDCTAFNDNALVTMSARAENIFTDLGKSGDIVIDRYRVTYIRADGRNAEGVEVPFAFDAATNFKVPVNGTATQQIMVVRPQAKLEPPLRNLAFGGGAIAISAIAHIDFWGKDIEGHGKTVRGTLGITFADFAEEDEEE